MEKEENIMDVAYTMAHIYSQVPFLPMVVFPVHFSPVPFLPVPFYL
jgi:hypothetical protein